MGDFNVVLNIQDRQHGNMIQYMETEDFREFMEDTGMNELHTVGRDYTWTNNHTYSKIDRGLVNSSWMLTMPSLQIQILEPSVSDHSPLKLVITQMQMKKARPFRFFNCIAEHPHFINEVDQAWNTTRIDGKMQGVWSKLKRVKEVIKGLNTQHYKGVDNRVKETRRELQEVQEKMRCRLQNAELIEEE
ncbi:PREDICTED: uncharacterized protein LOC109232561 [Nicotiana attenuata]|uniref:uncharacterized protein LOC109232561 n=1 Tax=Nicotiana attenuata TaxID=49451 RepID=UPI0009046490|nr:PREDICTED: uncharacterized protein LOC109232561 [Nicotiana attenuata]